MPVSTYWRVATGRRHKWQPRTLQKLAAALQGGRPLPRSRAEACELLAATYRGYAALIARELGADPQKVLDSDPASRATASAEWALAAKVRALAVYCVVIEFAVPAARVAAAIGVTRAAASQMLRRVEDFRDDASVDALVERVGRLISGRAE